MKTLCNTACLLMIGLYSFPQSGWIEKQVGNKIFVSFPKNPVYKLTEKARTYITSTENNVLMVLVQNAEVFNFTEFVKLPQEQQDRLTDTLLNRYIKGYLKATENDDLESVITTIGASRGREISFSSINPITGDPSMNFCKFLYAFNKVYTFQCKYLKAQANCQQEKDIFLNSVRTEIKSYPQLVQNSRSKVISSDPIMDLLTIKMKEKSFKSSDILEGKNDATGLARGIGGVAASVPEKYQEMNKELNLSPFNLPPIEQLDKMLADYERNKLMKKIGLGLVIIISIAYYIKLYKKNKNKFSNKV